MHGLFYVLLMIINCLETQTLNGYLEYYYITKSYLVPGWLLFLTLVLVKGLMEYNFWWNIRENHKKQDQYQQKGTATARHAAAQQGINKGSRKQQEAVTNYGGAEKGKEEFVVVVIIIMARILVIIIIRKYK